MYLLHRHGDTVHSQRFYEDAFLRAFPMLLDQLPPNPYLDSETRLRRCYTRRALEHFAEFFGLIRLTRANTDPLDPEYRITKTSLFDAAVQFHLD